MQAALRTQAFNHCGASAREARLDEIVNWDRLVTRFPNHRIVHQIGWLRSIAAAEGAEPIFIVFEKGSDIVGCLPGLVTRIGPVRIFGSPLAGWQTGTMGPVFDRHRISTDEMLTLAIPLLERRFNIHHVEMVSSELDHDVMRALGFRPEPVPTLRAPLFPGNEEKAMKHLKDSARRNIRRALKLGLQARLETDEAFVDEAYDQIKEVFARRGHTVPFSRKRVLEFFRQMKASGNLAAVSVYLPEGNVNIATGLFTIAGRELYLWQWAHRTQYRWYRPTELMTWTVMKQAMAQGCTTFDFMGLGDFKVNFGAVNDSSQYRWIRSRYGWLTQLRDLTEHAYRWQQSVRGRLAQRRLRRQLDVEAPHPAAAAAMMRAGESNA
jgi:CelD/BcsL family acetyltransferase involved in cellulose biosynthesis